MTTKTTENNGQSVDESVETRDEVLRIAGISGSPEKTDGQSADESVDAQPDAEASADESVDAQTSSEISAQAKKLTREEIGVLFARFRKQFRLDFAEKDAKKRAKSELVSLVSSFEYDEFLGILKDCSAMFSVKSGDNIAKELFIDTIKLFSAFGVDLTADKYCHAYGDKSPIETQFAKIVDKQIMDFCRYMGSRSPVFRDFDRTRKEDVLSIRKYICEIHNIGFSFTTIRKDNNSAAAQAEAYLNAMGLL